MEKKTAVKKTKPTFTKNQLVTSKKYRPYWDILAVVLDDQKQYNHDEVKAEIEKFLKCPVVEKYN